jgi:hypothetical protein
MHLYNDLDNDVVSRVEQHICAEASVFAGTQMSSWTTRVVEERLFKKNMVNVVDVRNISSKPDKIFNRTLYFDVEACGCEFGI